MEKLMPKKWGLLMMIFFISCLKILCLLHTSPLFFPPLAIYHAWRSASGEKWLRASAKEKISI
jgi:hypothetical protein